MSSKWIAGNARPALTFVRVSSYGLRYSAYNLHDQMLVTPRTEQMLKEDLSVINLQHTLEPMFFELPKEVTSVVFCGAAP